MERRRATRRPAGAHDPFMCGGPLTHYKGEGISDGPGLWEAGHKVQKEERRTGGGGV